MQDGGDFGLGHLLADAVAVEGRFLGHRQNLVLGQPAARFHQCGVERPVLVRRGEPGGERGLRGDQGIRAQNREFLDHVADVVVRLDQILDRREDLLAVAAAVVHELDHSHVAVRVADHRRFRVLRQLVLQVFQGRLLAHLLLLLLPGLVGPERIHQHVGIVEQVLLDDLPNLVLLRRGQGVLGLGGKGERSNQQREGQENTRQFHRRPFISERARQPAIMPEAAGPYKCGRRGPAAGHAMLIRRLSGSTREDQARDLRD